MRVCAEWRGLAGVGTIRVSSRLAWPCDPGATYARSPAAEARARAHSAKEQPAGCSTAVLPARSRMRAELALCGRTAARARIV
jgi:hypothetical protein